MRAFVVTSVLAGLAAGCQGTEVTPFPPGLEPLEADIVPPLVGPPTEVVQIASSDVGFIKVYGRGSVLAPPATVWAMAKDPEVVAAICSTDSHSAMVDNDPTYEFSFLLHYKVSEVVTVEWDDQWRFGTIEGTPEDPTFGMVKHQKVNGSTFITLSEGTIQLHATDDPNVSELDFVEHLDSIGGGVDDVTKGVRHTYASIVAAAHGQPVPACN